MVRDPVDLNMKDIIFKRSLPPSLEDVFPTVHGRVIYYDVHTLDPLQDSPRNSWAEKRQPFPKKKKRRTEIIQLLFLYPPHAQRDTKKQLTFLPIISQTYLPPYSSSDPSPSYYPHESPILPPLRPSIPPQTDHHHPPCPSRAP